LLEDIDQCGAFLPILDGWLYFRPTVWHALLIRHTDMGVNELVKLTLVGWRHSHAGLSE